MTCLYVYCSESLFVALPKIWLLDLGRMANLRHVTNDRTYLLIENVQLVKPTTDTKTLSCMNYYTQENILISSCDTMTWVDCNSFCSESHNFNH